ncbi:MAG TPA: contractile injection system tape measure protein [Bacteroidia bacterium]
MTGIHNIYQTVFDIQFFSKEENHEMQDKISTLFNLRITKEIDELFSDYTYSGETIQIKQLIIDTGRLYYKDLEHELPKRIINSISEELDKIKAKSSPGKTITGTKIHQAVNYYLTAIEHYLITGTPRWQEQSETYTIETLFSELLKTNSFQLVKLLKNIGKKEYVRKRIVYQFSESSVVNIIKALEPASGKIITNYIGSLLRVQNDKKIINTNTSEFRKANYIFTLTYLFTERGSVFNTRMFVRSLIKQMSAHYNISYKELLLTLTQSIRQTADDSAKKGLLNFIREIFVEESSADISHDLVVSQNFKSETTLATSKDVLDEYLYYFLEKGYPPVWVKEMPFEKNRQLFLQSLRYRFSDLSYFIAHSKRKLIAKHIIRFFKEEDAEEIIHHYHPSYSGWILSLQSAIIKARLYKSLLHSFHSEVLTTIIKEAILYATFISGTEPFNKKKFLMRVLKNVAHKTGVDIFDLTKEVNAALDPNNIVSVKLLPGEKEDYYISQISRDTENLQFPVSKNSQINALKYFLLHGEVPWWHDEKDHGSVEQLWESLLFQKKERKLIAFIRSTIFKPEVRKNMLHLSGNMIISYENLVSEEVISIRKIWPFIKSTFNFTNLKVFQETYLVYSFLRNQKKTAFFQEEAQHIFALYNIKKGSFYEEIIKLTNHVPNLHLNNYFSALLTYVAKGISYNERSVKIDVPEQNHFISDSLADQDKDFRISGEKKQPVEISVQVNSIKTLIDYLHTGFIASPLTITPKELVIQSIKKIRHKIPADESTLLYTTLKNGTSLNRLLSPLDEFWQLKITRFLFREEYDFLKGYFIDFNQMLNARTVKKQLPRDFISLIKATLLYFLKHYKKNIKVFDYVGFVIKQLFSGYSSYVTFRNLVKIAANKNEIQIKVLTPAILDKIVSKEKKREQEQKTVDPELNPEQDVVFITNAGLILLTPFFPFYFQTLGLTTGNKFTSPETAARAANLLEYLVTGKEHNMEHVMPLNKLLCGIATDYPLENDIKITSEEISLSEDLLRTAISRWEIIKSSSIEGFRDSFLKRAGKLQWEEDKISLKVEPRAYDMLVDKIPWNISIIKLPWMEKAIYTKWR